MRPSTVRRALVFAVCLAGVVALYWVPTAVRTPARVSVPATPHGVPTLLPVDVETAPTPDRQAVGSPGGTGRALPTASSDPVGPTTAPSATVDPPSDVRERGADPRADDPGSTAGRTSTAAPRDEPSPTTPPTSAGTGPSVDEVSVRPDRPAPGPVRDLRVVSTDYLGLTVAWAPDDQAAGYVVDLNGYRVAGTVGTEAALRWFNDDMTEHFVQVRAVGADGQLSRDPSFLRVDRPAGPTPDPTPTEPAATTSPSPTSSPTAQTEPSPTATR